MDEDNADVKVEVEDDVEIHPINLENQTPYLISSYMIKSWIFLTQYGWFIVLAIILLAIVWQKLQPHLRRLNKKREEQQEYAAYIADPSVALSRQEAMDRARRRLQEQHDAKASLYAEQMKKKEAEKRQARLDDWERHQQGKGYRSKTKASESPETSTSTRGLPKKKTNKNVYRQSDYNPLGGSGGGSSYRPSPRGGAGGG